MQQLNLHKRAVITGWDFSTGGVKHVAFDLEGNTLVTLRQTTDLWTDKGVSELNVAQLEGQAHASVRQMARALREQGRLQDWAAGGISATHHTCARIDRNRVQVRRAITWDDQTLGVFHAMGEERLRKKGLAPPGIIGGPWAVRYSLTHLVKDEITLKPEEWERSWRILPHGPLAAGFLTGNFDVISWSSAASTGMMNLDECRWEYDMLLALQEEGYGLQVRAQLPRIVDQYELIGAVADSIALEAGLPPGCRPLLFATSDDQQAGLVGAGCVLPSHFAIILGNSAVANSSSKKKPASGSLDVMRLNWGPYLWMRCYSNGAQFLDSVVGENPNWAKLDQEGRKVNPGCNGITVMPFTRKELALGVNEPGVVWSVPEPTDQGVRYRVVPEPTDQGVRYRAALEAVAYLVARGVREHEQAGQNIARITVSGGMARSDLMCEILASTLGRTLERLQSDEGPALGAAVTALSALETHLRRKQGNVDPFTVADAVEMLVKPRKPMEPNQVWQPIYARGLEQFEEHLKAITAKQPTVNAPPPA